MQSSILFLRLYEGLTYTIPTFWRYPMSVLRPVSQASGNAISEAPLASPSPLLFHDRIDFRQNSNAVGLSGIVQVFECIGDQLSHYVQKVGDFFFSFFDGLFAKHSTPDPISLPPTHDPYLPIFPNNPPRPLIQNPNPTSPLLINPAWLNRTPRVISIESMEQDLRAADAAVSGLNELLTFAAHNQRNLLQFIRFANSGNSEYFITLRSYFKGIIFEMRKETTTDEMKSEALQSLSQGFFGCPAIRFQSVEKVYNKLSGRLPTAEDAILEAFQRYKENVFIQHYRITDNSPFLNHIRREVGAELGLNTTQIQNDPNIDNGPRGTREEYLAVFNAAVSIHTLVQGMRTQLNAMMHDPDKSEALAEFLSQQIALDNHRQLHRWDLRQNYLRWGYEFSDEGTRFMIQRAGILTQ